MEAVIEIFGRGNNLTTMQMSMRAVLSFFITILLLRISGRRSFGMNMALDNVVTILLGAILSRGVVGASSFAATLAACVTLALLHRLTGWAAYYSDAFGRVVKGDSKIVYEDGKMIEKNLRHCMITEKDLKESIRETIQSEDFEKIKKIFVERNGKITVVKKKTIYE